MALRIRKLFLTSFGGPLCRSGQLKSSPQQLQHRFYRATVLKELGKPFSLEDVEETPSVSDQSVLVKVRCAGVNNYNADLAMERGVHPAKLPLSYVAGFRFAGEVLKTGGKVQSVAVGDRVLGLMTESTGAFAEECVARADEIYGIPHLLSYDIATSMPVAYGTALLALKRYADVKEGQTVLVLTSQGSSGIAAVDLAVNLFKCQVIACTDSDEKSATIRPKGVQFTLETKDDQEVGRTRTASKQSSLAFNITYRCFHTLEPDEICRACESETVSDGRPDEVEQANGPAMNFVGNDEENNYRPNYNMAPGTHAPIMLAVKQLDESASANDRHTTPMRWGFIPEWFDQDPEEFECRTFNCQLESLTGAGPEKKGLFKKAFNTGKRCAAVIDGPMAFYPSKLCLGFTFKLEPKMLSRSFATVVGKQGQVSDNVPKVTDYVVEKSKDEASASSAPKLEKRMTWIVDKNLALVDGKVGIVIIVVGIAMTCISIFINSSIQELKQEGREGRKENRALLEKVESEVKKVESEVKKVEAEGNRGRDLLREIEDAPFWRKSGLSWIK